MAKSKTKIKGVIIIRVKGTKGRFRTKLPTQLQNRIAELPGMYWFDPEDLTSLKKFFDYPNFWVGKLPDIKKALEQIGYKVKVYRPKVRKEFEWNYTGKPRKDQGEAIKALIKQRGGFLQATTGAGKTHAIAATVAAMGVKSLIIIYNTAPAPQMKKTFAEFTDIPFGIWGEGQADKAPVIVANIQTLISILKKKNSWRRKWLLEECELVFVDEAHKSVAPGTLELLEYLFALRHFYGTTATRRKDDRELIFDALYEKHTAQNKDTHIGYGNTIKNKYSVPSTFIVKEVPPKDYGFAKQFRVHGAHRRNQYNKVYNDYIVHGSTGRNKMIATLARKQMEKGRTVLVSVNKIDHAFRIHQMIKGSQLLVASAPYALPPREREELLEQFRNREFKCLVSTVVKEAVDIPSLDSVILAMGGKSEVLFEQSLRNTRACDRILSTGHYRKKRGYTFYFRDQADFLQGHSVIIEKLLEKIASQHPKNKFIAPKKINRNGKKKENRDSIRRVPKRVSGGKRDLTAILKDRNSNKKV